MLQGQVCSYTSYLARAIHVSLSFELNSLISVCYLCTALFENCFRWDTLSWPRKIFDQIDNTENQMEQDEQKFHKKLIDDQTQLEDKLDTLQVSRKVPSFYAYMCSQTSLLWTSLGQLKMS